MRTIIEMAHEVGFGGTASEFQIKAIERFVDLIRADEREACIKAIEDQNRWDMDDPESTAIKAIRARGNK